MDCLFVAYILAERGAKCAGLLRDSIEKRCGRFDPTAQLDSMEAAV